MPTLPRRRKPGTLAKNNTLNEVIDYLRGDTSQGLIPGFSDELFQHAPSVLMKVGDPVNDDGQDGRYKCKPLFLKKPEDIGGSVVLSVDASTYDDRDLIVHYLGNLQTPEDDIDLSVARTTAVQGRLRPGTLIEAHQRVRPAGGDAGGYESVWVSLSPGNTGVFAVKLNKTGGAGGDASGPATWVYTVLDMRDTVLQTTVTPTVRIWPRAALQATFGLAYYDQQGQLQLIQAYEEIAIEAC